jgi:hypothetical protein
VNDGHFVALGTAENDFDSIGRRRCWPRHLEIETRSLRKGCQSTDELFSPSHSIIKGWRNSWTAIGCKKMSLIQRASATSDFPEYGLLILYKWGVLVTGQSITIPSNIVKECVQKYWNFRDEKRVYTWVGSSSGTNPSGRWPWTLKSTPHLLGDGWVYQKSITYRLLVTHVN